MTASAQGLEAALKMLDGISQKTEVVKLRQAAMQKAAKATLVPPIRDGASGIGGKAGPIIAKAVSARRGKEQAVLVGPDRKKAQVQHLRKKTWNWLPIAHFFITGTKPHDVGGGQAGGTTDYFSAARKSREAGWKRTRGGFFRRSRGEVARTLMSAKSTGHTGFTGAAYGPIRVPGLASHDVVREGAERGAGAYTDWIAKWLVEEGM